MSYFKTLVITDIKSRCRTQQFDPVSCWTLLYPVRLSASPSVSACFSVPPAPSAPVHVAPAAPAALYDELLPWLLASLDRGPRGHMDCGSPWLWTLSSLSFVEGGPGRCATEEHTSALSLYQRSACKIPLTSVSDVSDVLVCTAGVPCWGKTSPCIVDSSGSDIRTS